MKSIKLSPISKKYYKDQYNHNHNHNHSDNHNPHNPHNPHNHDNYNNYNNHNDDELNTPTLEWHRVMKKLERLRVTNGVIKHHYTINHHH